MDDKHKKLIQNNFDELVESTHDIDIVIKILEDRNILNNYMVKHLNKYCDQKRKSEEFYEMIQGRGPHAFNNLIQALRESKNFICESILSSLKVSYFTPRPVEKQLNHLTTIENVINTNDNQVVVKIHPDEKFMDFNEGNIGSGEYRMRSKPRGLALIINIDKTLGLPDIKNSKEDFKKLQSLFSQLGYTIFSYENLELKDLMQKIIEFSKNEQLSLVDSFVVFIMSYGKQNQEEEKAMDLISSDSKLLKTSWIIEQFSPKNSPFAVKPEQRKPKLIFFQTRRVVSSRLRINSFCEPIENDCNVFHPTSNDFNRDADMFIVYFTSPGYPIRDVTENAYLVDTLCKIFSENAWNKDLDTMLGMVNDEIVAKNNEQCGNQFMDVVKRSVPKKFFFNPGLIE